MIRRVVLFANVLSLIVGFTFASQTWARVTLVDNPKELQISGTEAYPQLTFVFGLGLAMIWLARYFNSLFSKFLASAVLFLLAATALPVMFDSASSSLEVLKPQIAAVTGISDWLGQSQLISASYYNNFAADLTVLSVLVGFVCSTVLLWIPKPGQKQKRLSTRIDNLPSW